MNDFYIILTACLVAVNCAIMGSFLVMRKMV
ncbi:MAG: iron ABC transporter, partial [Bacteroidetes bacterium]|nr:iron ABC transporter [Bacteroidota bacterium]